MKKLPFYVVVGGNPFTEGTRHVIRVTSTRRSSPLTCSSVILRSIASLSSPKSNDDAELENKKKDTSSSISCSSLTTKPHKKYVINPWRIALNKTSGTRFWSRWCKWYAIVWYTCECLSEFKGRNEIYSWDLGRAKDVLPFCLKFRNRCSKITRKSGSVSRRRTRRARDS